MDIEKQDERFQRLFKRYIEQKDQPIINWDSLNPPHDDTVIPYSRLVSLEPSKVCNVLNKLVMVKLNGGLGVGMGCTGPKSIIQVRNDSTFLDVTVIQVEKLNATYDCDVPLVLMNSFNSHEDTKKVIQKYRDR